MGHPTVEVTLLFTDIEGSTALAHELGDAYVDLLAQHNRIIRDAIGQFTGVEARNEGDAFFAAFDRAADAVNAALTAQRALASHEWVHGRPVRVRMGLHTGPVTRLLHDFAGLNVHLASRVCSASHGGQVVASQSVRDALSDDAAFAWIELGNHIVKDFPDPITLHQLAADGLDTKFPPLVTIDARDHNLPALVTSFVGRAQELDELRALLSGDARLVTLTGPGGVGKTRLAIEAAWSVLSRFRGGAWFVDLAPVTDPNAIIDTIVSTLSVQDRHQLVERFAQGPTLLVLDNLEQLLSGVVAVSELLAECPKLVVLATTREHLRLQGEHEVLLDGLVAAEAVDLFGARAALVHRDFEVDDRVAALCQRVGGLPLAIELAAARLRTHSVDALLAAMNEMLSTLAEGERDRPPRHQAMRAAIALSVDALTEAERSVFRAFSVFGGGATVEAIGGVCVPKADEIDSLVDKSLLRRTEDRLTMLEPIRQFAEERLRLDSPGEFEQRVQAHARFFLDLTERLEPLLVTAQQREALDELAADQANLRLAIDRAAHDLPLVIASHLTRFWIIRGHTHEGRAVLDHVLAAHPNADVAARASAQAGLGSIALSQNDLASARDALAVVLMIGTPALVAHAHVLLGDAARRDGDLVAADVHFAEALAGGEASDDDRVVTAARNGQGMAAVDRGDYSGAADMFRKSLTLSEVTGDLQAATRAVGNLGVALMHLGDVANASASFERSLELARLTGSRAAEASALQNLAWSTKVAEGADFAHSDGLATASDYLRAAIEIFDELGYRRELAGALMALPAVSEDGREWLWALARAEGLLREIGDRTGLERVTQIRHDLEEYAD